MNVLQNMVARVELFDATKSAIGRALTAQQQLAVSAKLTADQSAFLTWLGTERGQAAARVVADQFTADLAPKEKDPQ